MDDLINRQAAIDAINTCRMLYSGTWGKGLAMAVGKLRELPPAQPEPKRGRWIKLDMHRGMADHKCTACEQECYVPTCMGEPMYAFCPNCGARMER